MIQIFQRLPGNCIIMSFPRNDYEAFSVLSSVSKTREVALTEVLFLGTCELWSIDAQNLPGFGFVFWHAWEENSLKGF